MSFQARIKPVKPQGATASPAPAAGRDSAAESTPPQDGTAQGALLLPCYLESLALVERMHRLLLDVIKDEFERLGVLDVNAVQALMLFNIGEQELTAGELKTRGYYQGSNVSYNLKKLVETGYMHHQRCAIDRRSVRVRLTDEGQIIRRVIADLFARHAEGLPERRITCMEELTVVNTTLRRLERYWSDQIRYIY